MPTKRTTNPRLIPTRLYPHPDQTTTPSPQPGEDGEKLKKVRTVRDTYTEPLSNREDWWRCQLRETPVPGSYEIDDFLQEEAKKPTQLSYSFRSEGRKREINRTRRGETLLPGEYEHKDFISDLAKRPITYGFKSAGRAGRDITQTKDKDINVSPVKYPMEKYLSIYAEKTPSKHMVFRSQVPRSLSEKYTSVPPLGTYNVPAPSRPPPMSSMFRSKTPRFRSAHTKTPGPGTYERTYQSPMPANLVRICRQNGIFFQSSFQY